LHTYYCSCRSCWSYILQNNVSPKNSSIILLWGLLYVLSHHTAVTSSHVLFHDLYNQFLVTFSMYSVSKGKGINHTQHETAQNRCNMCNATSWNSYRLSMLCVNITTLVKQCFIHKVIIIQDDDTISNELSKSLTVIYTFSLCLVLCVDVVCNFKYFMVLCALL